MIVKTCFEKPNRDNINNMIDYLNLTAKKSLSLSCIRQSILKTKWSERDTKLRDRSQILSAAIFLEYLNKVENIDNETVKTVIADLIPFIMRLDKNEDTSFLLISTNSLPSTIHFKHAQELFYKNEIPDYEKNNYSLDILVLYAIRLSLEKRVLGFLGIDYITSNKTPVGLSKLFPIIKNLINIKYAEAVKWNEIEWVNNWLNHHMHRHLRPYPWVIHQAFEILNPLLLPSKNTYDNNTQHLSNYASTYVIDEKLFHDELLDKIEKSISSPAITWANNREIVRKKTH